MDRHPVVARKYTFWQALFTFPLHFSDLLSAYSWQNASRFVLLCIRFLWLLGLYMYLCICVHIDAQCIYFKKRGLYRYYFITLNLECKYQMCKSVHFVFTVLIDIGFIFSNRGLRVPCVMHLYILHTLVLYLFQRIVKFMFSLLYVFPAVYLYLGLN